VVEERLALVDDLDCAATGAQREMLRRIDLVARLVFVDLAVDHRRVASVSRVGSLSLRAAPASTLRGGAFAYTAPATPQTPARGRTSGGRWSAGPSGRR
jgi:hypothetical protein